MKYLKLIRFKNLVIIALTMYCMRFGIIYTFLKDLELRLKHNVEAEYGFNFNFTYKLNLQMPEWLFACLVLSVILIAAAGYIINDYFDEDIDELNKPGDTIVGQVVSSNTAFNLHLVLSIVGIGLGTFVAYKIGHIKLGLIHVMASSLLWFYSSRFKRDGQFGFIIIALLVALVPLIALYEIPLLNIKYQEMLLALEGNFNFIMQFVLGFSLFAFLITLARELVKDMEDVDGDRQFGRKTLAVTRGIKTTKIITAIPIIAAVIFIARLQYLQFISKDYISFLYFLLVLQALFIFILIRLYRAGAKKDFTVLSKWIKLTMLAGLLYSLIIRVITLGF